MDVMHMEISVDEMNCSAVMIYVPCGDRTGRSEQVSQNDPVPKQPQHNITRPAGRGHELPTELLEEILLQAWLTTPLFNPVNRWRLFSRLSLVNRRFRDFALWMATRHVRVLSHSSMDVAAYRSIGQQCLALQQVPGDGPAPQMDQEQLLKGVFQHSIVYLDVTYAAYTTRDARDRWLKDDVSPGRPDDVYGVHFDLFASAFGEYTYPHPERREPEYCAWLARRRRDRLSGWFATLLAAVPDCPTLVLEANPAKPLDITVYSCLLEGFWWWKSLADVHLRVVPERISFLEEVGGMKRGPLPPLPALAAVRRVWLYRNPPCPCSDRWGTEDEAHTEECVARRMLEPFPGLRILHINEKVERRNGVVFAPDIVVRRFDDASEQTAEFVQASEDTNNWPWFECGEKPPRWVPRLNISRSDTLWGVVDPDGTRYGRDPSLGGAGLGLCMWDLY